MLKARQKETGAIVAIKKFKVRCRVRPCPAQSTAVLTRVACCTPQESDEDEQVRKTALREVRILKVRTRTMAPRHLSSQHRPCCRSLTLNPRARSNSSMTT